MFRSDELSQPSHQNPDGETDRVTDKNDYIFFNLSAASYSFCLSLSHLCLLVFFLSACLPDISVCLSANLFVCVFVSVWVARIVRTTTYLLA